MFADVEDGEEEGCENMSWNPVLDYFMGIKYEYEGRFGIDTHDVETWIEKLGLRDRTDFFDNVILNQSGDLLLVRYDLRTVSQEMWEYDNSIFRECRSVVLDIRKELVALASMRKFFNIGETEESSIENIAEEMKNYKPTFTNKLDGSMQMARFYNDKIIMAGSMALDKENSWRLDYGYKMLSDNHIRMLMNFPYYTFTFEFIHKDDVHVVKYGEEDSGLHLLAIRDSVFGLECSYEFVQSIAREFDVRCVELENVTFDNVMKLMKECKSTEKEGWVMFLNGRRVKIKCDDYVMMHKVIDKVSSDSIVIESVENGTFDDVLSKVPDSYRGIVEEKIKKVTMFLVIMNGKLNEYYNNAPKNGDKKEFMIWVNDNVPKNMQAVMRNKYLGREVNFLKMDSGKMIKMQDIEAVIANETC